MRQDTRSFSPEVQKLAGFLIPIEASPTSSLKTTKPLQALFINVAPIFYHACVLSPAFFREAAELASPSLLCFIATARDVARVTSL